MLRELVYYPDPILLTATNPVQDFDDRLHTLLDDMKETMLHYGGIGISANQVRVPLRVFIMKTKRGEILEFVNPLIEEAEPERANVREGCLSSPNVYQRLSNRSDQVIVKAQDRNGKVFRTMWVGLDAVCVQHEIDHLDGIFWFDRLPSRQSRRKLEREWEKQKKKLSLG